MPRMKAGKAKGVGASEELASSFGCASGTDAGGWFAAAAATRISIVSV